jgi:putative lipoprotein
MKKVLIPLLAITLTVIAFTSCEDVPAPYSINYDESKNPNPNTGGGSATTDILNTQETAWTVAQAIQKIKDANGSVKGLAYIKGIISKVIAYNSTYKSISYDIVDVKGNTEYIQVYSGKGLNGADFKAETDLNVGDQVVLIGNLKSYTNEKIGKTIMEVDKTSKIVSLIKGATPPVLPDLNTEATAWTTDQAVAKIKEAKSKLAAQAYVKGVITDVWNKVNNDGSLSYKIKTDGSTEEIQIYAGLNKGGVKFSANTDLKKGQTVIVKGYLMPFLKKDKKTIYEMDRGSVIVNITGEGTTPLQEDPKANPTKPVGAETIIDCSDFGKEDKPVVSYEAKDGTKLTFDKNSGSTPPQYFAKYHSVRMYAKNSLTIECSKVIKQIVITIDVKKKGYYNGNDIAYAESGGNKVKITKVSSSEVQFNGLSSNKVKIVNDFEKTSKGIQLRIKSIKIVYAN